MENWNAVVYSQAEASKYFCNCCLESGTPRLGSGVRIGIRRLTGVHCCLEYGTPRLAEWCE